MKHVVRLALAGLLCALVGAVPISVQASPAGGNPVLTAEVHDDYTILLKDPEGIDLDGRTLPAGTYTVEVDDFSTFHNFHLLGAAWSSCDRLTARPT